ncbi:anthranilate synthase component I [Altericista sp. CCNU0014]|uniref:anthranilate synthase component I n=1 Tax=Altericista sp. CCNU0014 TaxID=3082949 RepID=UPI00384F711B
MQALQPWTWRSLPLNGKSGTEVFAALFQHQPVATLLESPSNTVDPPLPNSRFSICAGSPRHRAGRQCLWTPAIGRVLDCLARRLQDGRRLPAPDPAIEHLPFIGGWLGWLGYDLAWEIETLPWLRSDALPFPVAFWYEPEAFAVLDHHHQQLWLAAGAPSDLDRLETHLARSPAPCETDRVVQQYSNPSVDLSRAAFERMVQTAKQHIQAGDVFQTNLSLRFRADAYLHPWHLYRALQQVNPSPFASYWQTPWGCVVSGTPERLVEYRQGKAQTRPIAGTRPRGQTPETDRAYERELLNSPKERAEHIMLVDLERNDLGRVCQWGSVRVDELLTVEFYSHVMHLVSNVSGQLHPNATPIDLIRAAFPGGTITGCPKVRCMEIIETLEPVRRSLFYGSCGYLDVRGHLDLNILIRTLLVAASDLKPVPWHQPALKHAQLWGQVGAGIVADSDPTQEWLESLQKAKAQWTALKKIAEYSC